MLTKRLVSVFMSIVLVAGLCPVLAFATQEGGVQAASPALADGDGALLGQDGSDALQTQTSGTQLAVAAKAKKVTLYFDSATKVSTTLKAKGLVAKKAKWTTSKKKVATVTKKGKVTAKKAGKATITAKQGKKTFKFAITSKKVSINKRTASIAVGGKVTLKLTGDAIKSVKSSKTKVAKITKKGVVTGVSAGTATITLTSKKKKKYTCKVTVKSGSATVDPSKPSDPSTPGSSSSTSTKPSSSSAATKSSSSTVTKPSSSSSTSKPSYSASEIKAAQEEKDAADAAVASAQAAVDTAQTAVDTANVQVAKGSFGFFESVGATAAIDALNRTGENNLGKTLSNADNNGKTFTSFTHQGDAKDATSLDNMKNAIKWMYRANELRAAEDIFTDCNSVPLMVSDTLMAMAQSNANWSDTIDEHADAKGGNYNVGENLAWNYGSDPFIQWYDEEKLVYREPAANADLNNDGVIGDNSGNLTGHYKNVVNSNYQSTGFAICTRGTMNGWTTFGQTFSRASYNGEQVFTVAAYETRFMTYYDKYVTKPAADLKQAQDTLDAAKARQATADATLKKMQG